MKKTLMSIAVIFCAAMAMTLTSCKKDAEDLIIGDWELVNMEMTTSVSGLTGEYAMYNQDTTMVETPEAGESQTMTFKKDGTVTIVTIEPEEETQTENGTYTIENENITLTVNNESQVFQLAVDKKTLSLTMADTQQLQLAEDQVATMSYVVKMNFKKKK
jgi:hypothetical protein